MAAFQIRKNLEENNIKVYPDVDNHDIDEEEIENNKLISVSEKISCLTWVFLGKFNIFIASISNVFTVA